MDSFGRNSSSAKWTSGIEKIDSESIRSCVPSGSFSVKYLCLIASLDEILEFGLHLSSLPSRSAPSSSSRGAMFARSRPG